MALELHQFAYNQDNYGVLLHDSDHGETAMVDAGDAAAARTALAATGWRLTQIWITHHHGDHTAGLRDIAGIDHRRLAMVAVMQQDTVIVLVIGCLLYTSPSPRD